MKSIESDIRRKERIQNFGSLRTRIVKSKKIYTRKKSQNLIKDFEKKNADYTCGGDRAV